MLGGRPRSITSSLRAGKSRITIILDDDLLEAFRRRADERGIGYQTLINHALREHLA